MSSVGPERPGPDHPVEARRGQRIGDVVLRGVFHRKPRLVRALGIGGLFSTAYGNVGSSIYYALGVVALSALGLTPAVLFFAGILFLFTALTYAEGATALPEAGGSGAFTRRAFNELASFLASWVLMMDYVVTISISAFSIPNYFGIFVPALATWPTNSLIAGALVVLLVGLNLRGVVQSARLNTGLSLLGIATQVTVCVVGVLLVINIPKLLGNVHWGIAPTTSQLLFGISISMVGFTGIETVANLGGETRNPGKNILRAVLLVFVAVLVLYTLLSMTALSAYPVHQAADGQWVTGLTQRYLQDPIMGIVQAMPSSIRSVMSFWVAILAGTILLVATNAGILGASRLAYFMGQRGQIPSFISRLDPKSHTPVNAIVIFSAFSMLVIATGRVDLMIDLYAFGAMLSYTAAHISIIALRIKEPNLPRPFKIPLSISIGRGRRIPILAVIGGLATSGTWFVVVYTHHFGRIIGFIWLAVGLAIYIIYRWRTHQSIFKTTKEV